MKARHIPQIDSHSTSRLATFNRIKCFRAGESCRWLLTRALACGSFGLAAAFATFGADNQPPAGFVALFNGQNLSNWKVPEGDNGHWKVLDGVIDYDAESEAKGDKSLWSEREFGDFVLHVDWRIKETPY